MLASPSSAHRTPQVNVLCFTAAMGKQYGFPPREVKAGFWKLPTIAREAVGHSFFVTPFFVSCRIGQKIGRQKMKARALASENR